MAEPTCDKCGAHDFESRYLEDAKTVLAFCAGCGHVVGAMPYYQDIAKTILAHFTRGSRDAFGHPVVRVKNEDETFG